MKLSAIRELIDRANRDCEAFQIIVWLPPEVIGPIDFHKLDERGECIHAAFDPSQAQAGLIRIDAAAIAAIAIVDLS
jgi:hypothetical protein